MFFCHFTRGTMCFLVAAKYRDVQTCKVLLLKKIVSLLLSDRKIKIESIGFMLEFFNQVFKLAKSAYFFINYLGGSTGRCLLSTYCVSTYIKLIISPYLRDSLTNKHRKEYNFVKIVSYLRIFVAAIMLISGDSPTESLIKQVQCRCVAYITILQKGE
jgi:hypothetical protein